MIERKTLSSPLVTVGKLSLPNILLLISSVYFLKQLIFIGHI